MGEGGDVARYEIPCVRRKHHDATVAADGRRAGVASGPAPADCPGDQGQPAGLKIPAIDLLPRRERDVPPVRTDRGGLPARARLASALRQADPQDLAGLPIDPEDVE